MPPTDETTSAAHCDVFISYHRATHLAEAGWLCEAFKDFRDKITSLTVFKDDTSLRTGQQWMQDLGNALNGCRCFVLLLGPRGLERWVGAETEIALGRYFDERDPAKRLLIVPVLLPGAPALESLPFLGLIQGWKWSGEERTAGELARFVIEQLGGRAPPSVQIHSGECPYLGLAAFQEKNALQFFGREKDVLDALYLLGNKKGKNTTALDWAGSSHRRPPGAPGAAAFSGDYRVWLQIVGASGSGKSSLMRAGYLPLVRQGALVAHTRKDHWVVAGPMFPGTDPVTELARCLSTLVGTDVDALAEKFRSHPKSLANQLIQWQKRQEAQAAKPAPDAAPGLNAQAAPLPEDFVLHARHGYGVLLAIDQFEELFTQCSKVERERFDVLLAEALEAADSPLHLVSTCRSDYQHRIATDLHRLAQVQRKRCEPLLLTAVDEHGLRECIQGPARLAGAQVEVGLVEALVADTRQDPASALPLVQIALTRLWDHKAQVQTQLNAKAYQEEGRVFKMLVDASDGLLAQLGEGLERQGAWALLTALAQYSKDGNHTRRTLEWEQAIRLAGQGQGDGYSPPALVRGEHVVQHLAGARQKDGRHEDPHYRLITVRGSQRVEDKCRVKPDMAVCGDAFPSTLAGEGRERWRHFSLDATQGF